MAEKLPEHVRALRRKNAWPRATKSVELIQTHSAYVFLLDDEVYKLKKAVNLGFLDFSTLEKRKASCESEVRLNRRGCEGGVYIGVETIRRDGAKYRVGGEGEIVDYAVHMKRLPQERMMDVLLEQGAVDFGMIGRVAARVAELHESAERSAEITRIGGYEQERRNWEDNLSTMRRFIGKTMTQKRFDRIEAFVESFLKNEAPLLRSREDDGFVRDCHGDLRSDAVCFDGAVPGGICVYDCIEFNDALRYSDTGLDAGFLAMDLDYRGHEELSDLFVGLYAAAFGDKELGLLLEFFKCYRATVRGKVESLLLEDAGVPAKQKREAARRARAYFALAERYARHRAKRAIVLVTGPSGSGKSVLAGVLASRLGAVLLSTDMVRRELYETREGGEALDAGVYAPEERERVYEEIEKQARKYVAAGRPVVIDGTYIERAQRAPIVALANKKTRLLVVECSAPDEVVRQRQAQRAGEAWTTSQGRYEVYEAQKAHIEPATEVGVGRRVEIDTTRELGEQIAAVEAKLRG